MWMLMGLEARVCSGCHFVIVTNHAIVITFSPHKLAIKDLIAPDHE